jgi:YggT family protein
MGSGYGTDALSFLVLTLFDLYVLVVALRFLMQSVRADYYNPVSQFVVKATNPLLIPLRRVIPGLGGHDVAAIALCIALLFLKLLMLQGLGSRALSVGGYLQVIEDLPVTSLVILTVIDLVAVFFNIFFFAIIIQAILSWISPGTYNPVYGLISSLTQPILRPVQRFVPPVGGLDLSPLVALIGLQVLKMLIFPPLLQLV